MSRIGKKPIVIPAGVTVTVNGSHVEVKGPKGTLAKDFDPMITIKVENNEVTFTRPNDEIKARSLHGTTRALVN
jgi:large subunit ribosomal protein L6